MNFPSTKAEQIVRDLQELALDMLAARVFVHPGASPGGETVDLIVHWGEVREGDLVLHDGEMRVVEERMAHTLRPDIKVTFRLSGLGMWQTCEIAKCTAVTRYVTTTED
jgi:hypothetical protein